MQEARIAVIYYSSTGYVHKLAEALAEGAKGTGAEVRLRRVAETAPSEAVAKNQAWQDHIDQIGDRVPLVSLEDLEWADGYALGSPTRYGNMTAQLKQFIDSTGGLWQKGALSNKVATAFTSAQNQHGGLETTILSINNTFYHWGSIIIPPGYTHQKIFDAGGNPYGASYPSGGDTDQALPAALSAARYQGFRLAKYARLLNFRQGSSD